MEGTEFNLNTVLFLLVCFMGMNSESVAQIQDSMVLEDSLNEISYMTFDVSLTSNNFGSSNQTEVTIPALFADISYYHKSGLYAGFMPVRYLNVSQTSYDMDFNLGFGKYFDSGFYLDANYLNHNYHGDSTLIGINYVHGANLSINYTYNGMYLFFDGSATFGVTQNYFLDLGLGYYASFQNIFTPNDNLSLFPMISLSFGTDAWLFDDLTFWETYQTKVLLKVNGYQWDTFDLQMLTLSAPLTYYLGNFSAGFTYLYSIPGSKYEALSWEKQSAFMLSVGYMLNFK
jgi:hypothetical protein